MKSKQQNRVNENKTCWAFFIRLIFVCWVRFLGVNNFTRVCDVGAC